MNKNYTQRKNLLRGLLLGDEAQKVNKTSIAAIFRALIEPMIECKENSVILVKIKDVSSFENIIKRINFINPNIYSFSSGMDFLKNVQENTSLEETEFLIIMSPRYSAAMIWDYPLGKELGYEEGSVPLYVRLNSVNIAEITESLLSSVDLDISDLVKQYTPERRSNDTMNEAINNIVKSLDGFSAESNLTQLQVTETTAESKPYGSTSINQSTLRNLSHEIKNHLSVIDLYSKIIEKKLCLITKGEDFSEIEASCNSAISSIRKSIFSVSFLLNTLRGDEGKLGVFDLKKLTDSVIELAQAKTKEKNIKIHSKICENLMILADEIKFQNVILNLLYNASDAISESGEINLSAEKQERYIKLLVEDNGGGISPDISENLFKEGFTTKQSGHGLGLSICKETMLNMGGDIRLVSSKSGCTVFEVIVPCAQ